MKKESCTILRPTEKLLGHIIQATTFALLLERRRDARRREWRGLAVASGVQTAARASSTQSRRRHLSHICVCLYIDCDASLPLPSRVLTRVVSLFAPCPLANSTPLDASPPKAQPATSASSGPTHHAFHHPPFRSPLPPTRNPSLDSNPRRPLFPPLCSSSLPRTRRYQTSVWSSRR